MLPFGPTELILILAIVVIVFGVGKLAHVGGALGQSIRDFRQETAEAEPAAPPAKMTSTTEAVGHDQQSTS